MRNHMFVKTLLAGAAIAAHRIVMIGAADNTVIQATAGKGFGVADALGFATTNDGVDVILAGIAEIEYGGNVALGDMLTADADGKAVKVSDSGFKVALIAGGAAGDHTVTGILAGDELIAVLESNTTSAILTDLSAEFTVDSDDTINNDAGTATTDDKLLVIYRTPAAAVAIALEAGVSGDIHGALLVPGNA